MRAFILVVLVACGAEMPAPPDAPLPLCADVGCPDAAYCNTAGDCRCPQTDGESIACRFEVPDGR